MKLTIGTRGSRLAIVQSEAVRDMIIERHPDFNVDIKVVKTKGDKILDVPLSKIGDKGLFTKELEVELINGTIDMAVHSMKDMPTSLPEGLIIGAVTKREDPRDVFISDKGVSFQELGPGKTVATSSLRRRAQLLALFPGLNIVDIRGNVQTRMKKMHESPDIHGIILAKAGIDRLEMQDVITDVIPADEMIPAVGQASLAVEIRENDERVGPLVAELNHEQSYREITCERAFLRDLEGGCQVPLAGYASIENNMLHFNALVASLDGTEVLRREVTVSQEDFEKTGSEIAADLIEKGADRILRTIYDNIDE